MAEAHSSVGETGGGEVVVLVVLVDALFGVAFVDEQPWQAATIAVLSSNAVGHVEVRPRCMVISSHRVAGRWRGCGRRSGGGGEAVGEGVREVGVQVWRVGGERVADPGGGL